ncbi:MAG: hypothetical protein LH472_06905 [Pyrinomonadaceae bacterium]|nr:hypothetical protein [Pyrinomonadaceae bacterium]
MGKLPPHTHADGRRRSAGFIPEAALRRKIECADDAPVEQRGRAKFRV